MENQFFAITDESGKTAGVISANSNTNFKNAIVGCCIDNFEVDDVVIDEDLDLEEFSKKTADITIRCINSKEENLYYDIRIESVLMYS